MIENYGGGFQICYHPIADIDTGDIEEELRAVCRQIWLARQVTICIDEIWRFCEPSWAPLFLKNLTLAGGHRGITVLYTAQQPALVAKNILRCATHHYVFRMDEGEASYIQKIIRMPDEVAAALPELPDRVYFYRDDRMQWRKSA